MDMSEFMEKHAVARLIGSPPGYVGYDDGGQLTEKVRKNPFSVILFDEIEKAHPDFVNILLQILEEGELTDGSGLKVSFKESIVILTSNIGTSRFDKLTQVGFNEDDKINYNKKDRINSEISRTFNPELINRLDEIVFFNELNDDDIVNIVHLYLSDLVSRLKENNVFLSVDDAVVKHLASLSYNRKWGARHVRRTMEVELEDLVATEILRERDQGSFDIKAVLKDGSIILKRDRLKKNTIRKENSGAVHAKK
jgi:ATP-dependent Clp protease ATP-binding subunit ClpC